MNNIKITTLVENTVTMGIMPLTAEHGLSFLIESGDRKILFDTGQGLTIIGNTKALGIDLSKIDTVVLSHAHFDHTGGVKNIIESNNHFTLVAHPEVFFGKFAGLGGDFTPIGIGTKGEMEIITKSGIKLEIGEEPFEIAPGIMTTGIIPMETDFEEVEAMFFKGEEGSELTDLIEDDKALILDTEKGTVVILGCAHRGIINTLNHVVKLTGKNKIYAIMGGLHLIYADKEKLNKISNCIRDFGIEKMIVGHCTGFSATNALVNEFGDRVTPNTVGHVIEF
ncbi:MAG: MBL fold metallo-hydrolase [Desulfobacterales bacterium]|jgi:7,8-dihydropterin-6-yl-methyl-4-(beta-D-ribofuranosyl)aminobenzene 5'-phosphate synthase|nr:MBL fold metallo-hydrolase [Desulfobacteraceae bacterium]MBT4365136.1 MBL fold metallo-hydrolase [Desulfobacteraceae bacterium]MBT7698307.1 MBL fold metallo-hydrolase [Desulfobacterales bacterium]